MSVRCKAGLHQPTRIPRALVAAYVASGEHLPRVMPDRQPYPGGYAGRRGPKWCVRCGADLEPNVDLSAVESLSAVVDHARRGAGLPPASREESRP